MSNKMRLVWYGPSRDLEIIGDVQVNKDGSFSGQITDQRVKRMIEADAHDIPEYGGCSG